MIVQCNKRLSFECSNYDKSTEKSFVFDDLGMKKIYDFVLNTLYTTYIDGSEFGLLYLELHCISKIKIWSLFNSVPFRRIKGKFTVICRIYPHIAYNCVWTTL